jgi:hypothetical protein
MPQLPLNRPRIVAFVGEGVAAGVISASTSPGVRCSRVRSPAFGRRVGATVRKTLVGATCWSAEFVNEIPSPARQLFVFPTQTDDVSAFTARPPRALPTSAPCPPRSADIRRDHWSRVECFAVSISRSANCLSPQVRARADALAQVGVWLAREGRGAAVFIVAINR